MRLTNSEIPIRIKQIRKIACIYNWRETDHQENIGMLIFNRLDAQINIYYTKMTVTTCIKHPKLGKTQLFRRNVYFETLEKIFKNPRTHTGLGYYNIK